MADWALIFLGVYVLSAFVLRSIAQKIRTGSTGFKGISGAPGRPSGREGSCSSWLWRSVRLRRCSISPAY
ncbi:MAG: hypothetical protein M3454_06260 [Actinomycetota bacterium]|nr:hypothetical protein [Actinomycetota bacterium]